MYIKPLMPTGLAVNVKIIPEFFQDEGYTTHAIGKWHLGFHEAAYTPRNRGFDQWYGIFPGGGSHTGHFSVSQTFTVRKMSSGIGVERTSRPTFCRL